MGGGCRFDCLCVVKDQVDAQMDERLAKFVVQSHHHSHPANDMDELQRAAAGEAAAATRPGQAANAIDQELLRLYIAYAKKHCHPKLQDADTAKMVQVRCPCCFFMPVPAGMRVARVWVEGRHAEARASVATPMQCSVGLGCGFVHACVLHGRAVTCVCVVAQVYTELRREAGMTHAMPVAVRHLESMIRMSEAHARMHLREKVEPQDIDIAIRLMLESFIQVRPHPACMLCAPTMPLTGAPVCPGTW